MKVHQAVVIEGAFGADTRITTTLCGRMNAKSDDGMNSSAVDGEITCKFCRNIIADQKHWRHRKYLAA